MQLYPMFVFLSASCALFAIADAVGRVDYEFDKDPTVWSYVYCAGFVVFGAIAALIGDFNA